MLKCFRQVNIQERFDREAIYVRCDKWFLHFGNHCHYDKKKKLSYLWTKGWHD